MQLALSTTITPPSLPVWEELSGNSRRGFTTKNQAWNPGSNVVNSTTQIGFWPSLFLEGFRQSHSARYYNALTGRFMSQDPQQHDPLTPLLPFTYHSLRGFRKPLDPTRWHRYLYANADPVNMIDPSGRDAAETGGADADSINLTEKTIEEIKETSFVDKFNDVDAAMDQLESLEDNLSYCDEGYCGSSKKSLDALINIAKTLKFLP